MKKLLLVAVVGLSLLVSVNVGTSVDSEMGHEEQHPQPDVALV
ncbi:hypothetical protein U0355_03510 [Salimicrobium sp. PL1-032A]